MYSAGLNSTKLILDYQHLINKFPLGICPTSMGTVQHCVKQGKINEFFVFSLRGGIILEA